MRYDATTANAIEATGLVKRFGKTTALDGVDLVARQGRVLGVLGPNGAGKPVTELRHSLLARPGGLSLTWSEVIFSDAPTVLDIRPPRENRDALLTRVIG